MRRFEPLHSPTIALLRDDVDTDQIIPARFLKGTTSEGLGERLFADWRYSPEGTPRPDFPLNRPEAREARVLVVGRNFGCGSSREHAVWALAGFGFRAVVGLSFADIFRANALKNGLLPVAIDPAAHEALASAPGAAVTIDLETRTIDLPGGGQASFPIAPFARHCLLNGIDELDFLIAQEEAIATHERRRSERSVTPDAEAGFIPAEALEDGRREAEIDKKRTQGWRSHP